MEVSKGAAVAKRGSRPTRFLKWGKSADLEVNREISSAHGCILLHSPAVAMDTVVFVSWRPSKT